MRQLLCAECAADKKPGVRECYPGEWERVVFGTANLPTPEQRVMKIDGEVIPLPAGSYDCDCCDAAINPGDRCCAWTVWVNAGGGMQHQLWEPQFLTPDTPVTTTTQ
jgi:hypothetical protein